MRESNNVGAVFVLIQLSQIADHVASGIGDNAMGIDSSTAGAVGEDSDGLWTNAVLLVQALHTEEESILRVGETGRVADRDGPCSFSEDILRRRVDERDESAVAIHTQSAVLSDGCQEGTLSQRWRGRFAMFGIDDVGGDVVRGKVSIALVVVSGFKVSFIASQSYDSAVRTLPTLSNEATPVPNPTLLVST
jgi:hypothetical protein